MSTEEKLKRMIEIARDLLREVNGDGVWQKDMANEIDVIANDGVKSEFN